MKGWIRLTIGTAGLVLSTLGCSLVAPAPAPTPTPFQVVIVVPGQTLVPTPTATLPQPTDPPVPTATATQPPTSTPEPSATPVLAPTETPGPTLTPSITPTVGPSPTSAPIDSGVCVTCQPYLREAPGTMGRILGRLDEKVQFTVVGRTEDGAWLQVILKNDRRNRQGWVFRDLTALREAPVTDLGSLAVTGIAADATPAPANAVYAAGSVSGVTSKSREIFLRGQALGNKPGVFTRVGDSITASPYFLNGFSTGGFDLGAYQNELWDVVQFFQGSFGAASIAAGNGWGADIILRPGGNAADVCGQDSPLVCEYRLRKPSIALIMIGTNDSGGVSPAEYEGNLRRIVEISIEMGVIPVLSTIPPKPLNAWNAERAIQWNAIIASVARQYDVPLVDLYTAMTAAPNQGIGDDGVHPSVPPDEATTRLTAANLQYGYTIRNLVALQALNAVWRNVIY